MPAWVSLTADLPGARSRRTFPPIFLRCARILVAAFCVMVVAQQTNVGSLAFGDECRDKCPDEDGSRRCPLNCMSCTCVGHGIPVSLAVPVVPMMRLAETRLGCEEPKRLPDPQPAPIFHVPRPLLV